MHSAVDLLPQNVSSIAWNKARPDLLAVGYGSFDFTYRAGKFTAKPADQEDAAATGFMALWSLKSPEWPLVSTSDGNLDRVESLPRAHELHRMAPHGSNVPL